MAAQLVLLEWCEPILFVVMADTIVHDLLLEDDD